MVTGEAVDNNGAMKVTVCASARDFLAATERFRGETPAITSVIGSVAAGVAGGRQYERELWITISDEAGVVVGCAMRTAPFNLTVSDMPPEAVPALARVLREGDPDLPGIAGPRDTVAALIHGLGLTGTTRLHMEDVVRVLGDLMAPRYPVPGLARAATLNDVDLLERWFAAFAAESGAAIDEPRAVAHRGISDKRFWLWCVEGSAVAVGGHAPLAETPAGKVGRIGSIYTEPTQRGQGYGSAITHHIAQQLLTTCSTVLLYADAANPTSNSIYEHLGFTKVAEIVEFTID